MTTRKTILSGLLVCASVLSAVAQSSSGGITLDEVETIFAFGDSYSWNGYTPLLGVNTIPGYGLTTSGGYNWLQFLSQLGSQPITLYDLAAAGATTNNSVIAAAATDFVNQVGLWNDWFLPDTGTYTSAGQVAYSPNSTLYTVWIGINDVGASYDAQTNFTQQLSEIFTSYNAAIASLYTGGARNFLILGVPPTWRTPLMQAYNDSRIGVYTERLAQYNEGLAQLFSTFGPTYSEAFFQLYDTQPFFNTILDNPSEYGFLETTTACAAYSAITDEPSLNLSECIYPLSEYFWWNDYHPTWTVHELLASVLGGILTTASDASPSTTLTSLATDLPTSISTAGAAPSSSSGSMIPTTTTSASASGSVGPLASTSSSAGGGNSSGGARRFDTSSSRAWLGAGTLAAAAGCVWTLIGTI